MAQTLAQILAGAGGDPYQPAAPGGGMSPLIQMLMQAQQMGSPGQGGMLPGLDQGMGALGPGGIPGQTIPQQQALPIPGQPAVPGLGSLGQPWPPGMGGVGGVGGIY